MTIKIVVKLSKLGGVHSSIEKKYKGGIEKKIFTHIIEPDSKLKKEYASTTDYGNIELMGYKDNADGTWTLKLERLQVTNLLLNQRKTDKWELSVRSPAKFKIDQDAKMKAEAEAVKAAKDAARADRRAGKSKAPEQGDLIDL